MEKATALIRGALAVFQRQTPEGGPVFALEDQRRIAPWFVLRVAELVGPSSLPPEVEDWYADARGQLGLLEEGELGPEALVAALARLEAEGVDPRLIEELAGVFANVGLPFRGDEEIEPADDDRARVAAGASSKKKGPRRGLG